MVTRSPPLSGPLLHSWLGGGLSTIFIPLLVFVCSRRANSYHGNDDDQNNDNSPWWFFGTTIQEEDGDNQDSAPPVLIATYLWSQLVFWGILFYGVYAMRAGTDLTSLVVALVLFANYSLLALFLLGGVEGAIETSGPAVEENGFVGQFGVMVRNTLRSILFYIYIYTVPPIRHSVSHCFALSRRCT
jgi:hypothetical protein